jgi:hypothetical protein
MDEIKYMIFTYEKQYHNELLVLLADLWGKDIHLNNSYFEWKYLKNPYDQSPLIYMALAGNKLVGVRSFCVTHWQAGNPGTTFLSLADADTVIDQDYRRKGLFSLVNQYSLEALISSQYKTIITLSANRGSAAAVLKMGWKNVGFIQTAYYLPSSQQTQGDFFSRILQKSAVHRFLNKHLRQITYPQTVVEGTTFEKLDQSSTKIRSQLNQPIFVLQEPQPEAMAELVERVVDDGRIRQVRDNAFFQWRYKNPRSKYRFLYWGNVDKIDGYIVLRSRINERDGNVMIVDWETENLDIFKNLLNASIKLGQFRYLSTWSESLSHEKKKMLKERGFSISTYVGEEDRDNFPPIILVNKIADNNWKINNCNILDVSNWDLRPIYADGI